MAELWDPRKERQAQRQQVQPLGNAAALRAIRDAQREPMTDLYDHEVMALHELQEWFHREYIGRDDTPEVLRDLGKRAEDKGRSIGLIIGLQPGYLFLNRRLGAHIDPESPIGRHMGPYPTLAIFGRMEEKPFDPERQSYEVKKGVADAHYEPMREREAIKAKGIRVRMRKVHEKARHRREAEEAKRPKII